MFVAEFPQEHRHSGHLRKDRNCSYFANIKLSNSKFGVISVFINFIKMKGLALTIFRVAKMLQMSYFCGCIARKVVWQNLPSKKVQNGAWQRISCIKQPAKVSIPMLS